MAGKNAAMTAKRADARPLQQQFPFMKLPKELRLAIYEFAIEDFIDSITAYKVIRRSWLPHQSFVQINTPTSYWIDEYQFFTERVPYGGPPYTGPLGFLHTNFKTRAESAAAMLSCVKAHFAIISAQAEPLRDLDIKEADVKDLEWEDDQYLDIHLAMWRMEFDMTDSEAYLAERDQWATKMNHRWKVKKVLTALEEAARSSR